MHSFVRFVAFAVLAVSLSDRLLLAQPAIDSLSVPNSIEEMGVSFALVSASGAQPLTVVWSFASDATGQAFFFDASTGEFKKTASGTSAIFGVGNPGPDAPNPSLQGQQFTLEVSVSDGIDTVVQTRDVVVSGVNQKPVIDLDVGGMGTQANPRVSPQGISVIASQSFDPDGTPVSFAWRLGTVRGGQTCPGRILVVFGKETDKPSLPLPLVTARPQDPMQIDLIYRVFDGMYVLEGSVPGFGAAQNGCTEGGLSSGVSQGLSFGCQSVENQPAVATAPASYTILQGLQGQIQLLNASDPDNTPGPAVDGQPGPPGVFFEWAVTNGRGLMETADLANRTTETVSFSAPQVESDEIIGLEVLVRDAAGCGTKYPVDLAVLNFLNDDPRARLGYEVPGQNLSGEVSAEVVLVTSPATVELDAAASTDSDGDPLTFSWEASGEGLSSGATILAPDAAQATLTVLAGTQGSVTVTVTVSDHRGGTATRKATFLFFESIGAHPVAVAEAFQGNLPLLRPLGNGEELSLDASDSTLPGGTQEEIDNLAFEWIQIAGSPVLTQHLNQPVARVRIAGITVEENLLFQLLVRNGSAVDSDVVQVPVVPDFASGPDAGASEVYFPIAGFGPIGDGTVLETSLVIENVGLTDLHDVSIVFLDREGDPLDVAYRAGELVDLWDPEIPLSLLGHTSRVIEFLGATDETISSGWARVRSSGRLRGSVRFQRVAGNGEPVQDVGIFSGNRGRRFQTPFRNRDEFALALANPGDAAVQVELFLFLNDDPSFPVATATQVVGPMGMEAFFLAERFPEDLPIEEGTLILAVEGEGQVSATGLVTLNGFFVSAQSISRIE